MSLFVAIPSGRDLKEGFSRLKLWKLKSEWIYVAKDGVARKSAPNLAVSSGLVLVSLAYLKLTPTPQDGSALFRQAEGVFIHPGGTDTPNLADAARALEDVPADFRYQILAKTVAFTRSGTGDCQVAQLTRVWNWMSSNPQEGEEHKISGFDLNHIQSEFGRLRGRQGRDAIARLCLLAQGSIDRGVAPKAKSKFAEELQEFLKGEGAWLQRDDQLGSATKPLLEKGLTTEAVAKFLEKVRDRFSEHAG